MTLVVAPTTTIHEVCTADDRAQRIHYEECEVQEEEDELRP